MTDAEVSKLVFPVCTSVGATGLSAYVVHWAAEHGSGRHRLGTRGLSGRDEILAQMLHALARWLGLPGAIALAVVVTGLSAAWLFFTWRGLARARAALAAIPDGPAPPPVPPDPALEAMLGDEARSQSRELSRGGLLLVAISVLGGAALVALGAPDGLPLALVGALFGALLAALRLRDPTRNALVERLSRRGHEAVWVYVEVAPEPKPAWLARWLNSQPTGRLVAGFADGALRELAVRRGREAEVFEAARRATPYATHGYSAEAKAAYDKDPRALRRATWPA